MIGPTDAVRVMLATRLVDFRRSVDGLAALVRETMGADPLSGAVYMFRAKRADGVQLVFWDGMGMVLVAKRLEEVNRTGFSGGSRSWKNGVMTKHVPVFF